MAVSPTDLYFCGAANHAEADSGTQGGAISKGVVVVFSGLEMTAPDALTLHVDVSATAIYRVTGRTAAGAIVTEDFEWSAESGNKVGSTTMARILKVVKLSGSLPSTATLTIKAKTSGLAKGYLRGSSKNAAAVEQTEIRRLFIGATIPAASTDDYFEKFFVLNTAGTDVSEAAVKKTADPDGLFDFALDSAADGTTTSSDRKTAPASGTTSFSDADKACPSDTLPAGSAIGVWVKMTLDSGLSPAASSLNLQLAGKGF
jgi:hypothetical protein